MTYGASQEPMAEIPQAATAVTTYIDDDPTLPRLTMTNGILVPVVDPGDEEITGPVPCQYYTVTSFCQNPKHMDLNYANQHQFQWNKASPILGKSAVKTKPREIIHKIHYEGSLSSEESDQENRPLNHGISFVRNNRACSVINLALVPARRGRITRSTPPQPQNPPFQKLPCEPVVSSPDLRDISRQSEPNPPPVVRYIPIAPPRNRNSSHFRSSSQAKENVEFQSSPPVGAGQKRHSTSTTLLDLKEELLTSQFERKEKLKLAVQSKQSELTNLKREVQFLQSQLEPLLRIERLTRENELLQHQCNQMTSEVDYMTNGSIPLGETNSEYYRYRERSPRQESVSYPSTPLTGRGESPGTSRAQMGRLPTGSQLTPPNRKVPPPRPPPPNTLRIPWDCTKCTFRNHPDLSICEQCEMIRVMPSSPNPTRKKLCYRIGVSLEHAMAGKNKTF